MLQSVVARVGSVVARCTSRAQVPSNRMIHSSSLTKDMGASTGDEELWAQRYFDMLQRQRISRAGNPPNQKDAPKSASPTKKASNMSNSAHSARSPSSAHSSKPAEDKPKATHSAR
eukprot:TRINITY_DN903_c0_g1_i1.p1 TRINITY_DN903_c0_g1~~TRINITY_DN903_c0_g1_i1.p1  ORF type:complete len:116 (+),score=27.07 TRINITY_DN903_c0_g1_i1:456-803(+)